METKEARKIRFRQVVADKSQEKLMYYSENNDSLVVSKFRKRPDIFLGKAEISVGEMGDRSVCVRIVF